MSQAIQTETSLTVSRHVRAPRNKVYEAFTNPETLAKWYAPGPMTTTVHKLEPKANGQFKVTMHGGKELPEGMQGDHTGTGTFLEIDPGHRLVHTWSWESDDPNMSGESRITVTLEDVDGGTKVTLVHEQLPNKESVASHTEGWTGCLEKLAALY